MSIASSIAAFEGAGARVKLGGANVSRRSRTSSRSDRSLCCSWEDQQREMIRRRESSRRTGCPPSPKLFRRQPHVDTKEEASPSQNDEEEDAVSISSSKADNNEAYRWAAENNSFSEISYDSNDSSFSSLQMESKQGTVTDHRPLTSSPKKNMLSPRKIQKSNLPPQLPRRTKSLRQSSRASGDAVASKNQKQVSWNEKIKVKCDSIGALPLEHEDDPTPNKHDVQTKKLVSKQVVNAAKTCSPKALVEKRGSNDTKKSISKEAAKVARARTTVQEPVQKRSNNDAKKKVSKEARETTLVDNDDDENWQVSDMCLTGPIPYFVLFQTMRVDKLCFLVSESHAESLRNSPVVAFNCSFPLQRDDAYEVQHFFKTNNISKNNVCLSCEVITGYPKQFAAAVAQQLAHRLSKLTSPCS